MQLASVSKLLTCSAGACRNHHYPARKNARLRVRAFGHPHGDASKNGSNVGNALPQRNCRSRIARVVYYIESRRFLIRDSPRPATTYEQKTGGADGVKGA